MHAWTVYGSQEQAEYRHAHTQHTQGHRLTLAGAWLLWAAPAPWPYLTGVEGLPTVPLPCLPFLWHMGADHQGENSALPGLAQKSHRWWGWGWGLCAQAALDDVAIQTQCPGAGGLGHVLQARVPRGLGEGFRADLGQSWLPEEPLGTAPEAS